TNVVYGIVGDNAHGLQALYNRITNAAIGITTQSASGLLAKGNTIKYALLYGVYAQGDVDGGDAPVIQGNIVNGATIGVYGICTRCFGGLVATNTVTEA